MLHPVCHPARIRPSTPVVVARPDADIRVLLLGATEPGGDQAAGVLGDGRGVALRVRASVKTNPSLTSPGNRGCGRSCGGRASQLLGGKLDAVLVPDEIDPAVLRADEQVRFAVAIEIADGRAAGVPGDVAPGEVADLLENDFAVAGILAVAPPGSRFRNWSGYRGGRRQSQSTTASFTRPERPALLGLSRIGCRSSSRKIRVSSRARLWQVR